MILTFESSQCGGKDWNIPLPPIRCRRERFCTPGVHRVLREDRGHTSASCLERHWEGMSGSGGCLSQAGSPWVEFDKQRRKWKGQAGERSGGSSCWRQMVRPWSCLPQAAGANVTAEERGGKGGGEELGSDVEQGLEFDSGDNGDYYY